MSYSTDSTPVGAADRGSVPHLHTAPRTAQEAPAADHHAMDVPTHEADDMVDASIRYATAPSERWANGVDWPTTIWLGAVHLGVLAAPWTFTWVGLTSVFVLHWLTGGVGICLGFHRLLTHMSFETYRPVKWFLALCGGLAGEGSAIHWVAIHRKHHAHSDHDGDPHSPKHGGMWSHMWWIFPKRETPELKALHKRWVPDLLKDPVMRWMDLCFLPINIAFALALYAFGAGIWDHATGVSMVVYGMFVRMTYVLHSTWFVNSATHIWGYRNYNTTDDSRNLWWVAVLTYGEGWHNNHHAHPRTANHGHQWWEFDLTYSTICLLERCGLAWKVARKRAPQHKLNVS